MDCLADEFCANSIKEQTYTCTLSGKNLNWELDKDGVNVGMKTYNESSAILMVEPIETMSPFTAVLVVNDGSTMESNLTFTPLIDMDGLLIQCYKKMNTSISSCTVIIAGTIINDNRFYDNYECNYYLSRCSHFSFKCDSI